MANGEFEVDGISDETKSLSSQIVPSASHRTRMEIQRFFTKEGMNPFDFNYLGKPINWVSEEVKVTDDKGKVVFTQPNVKRPDFWSPLAIKIVASKYFWGDQAKNEREDSVEKLIGRVSRFIGRQAFKQGYLDEKCSQIFRDEISAICLNQIAVFNSPVWFNAGIWEYNKEAGGVSAWKWDFEKNKVVRTQQGKEVSGVAVIEAEDRPQCSACFILGMEDNMESILGVQIAEANLFKGGSGSGSNRSVLRSSKETLTGGGKPSGPVSFMRGYDAYAAIIQAGGKTRRAAKMEILNISHPDIIEFIEAKQKEEKKAWALIAQGYDGGLSGDAYRSVCFQNANMSVRVTDEFMHAVKNNGEWKTKMVTTGEECETFKARDLLNKIAEGTHLCGDPGIQCDTIINKYHTCKNSGRQNATNPCSEYSFLDDSACNLASINLLKFLNSEGVFDVEKFKKVVRTFILAMEIIVDGASYPTEKITKMSHDFRALGLGYANLGALLMALGLPYDSDEGRAVVAAITAIMCGEAYKTSAEIAKARGPFRGFEMNRELMLKVIEMQREHVREIDVEKIPLALRYLVNDAWDCWSEALEMGEKKGYRNAQVTVLAPTGTISFMMDCSTTGIEPGIALVSYKVLSGGGMLKMVNSTVPMALKKLGYSEEEVKGVISYIEKNDMIEGAPGLKSEHLSVFDCAFKPAKGKRSIHYKGHIKMMGAVQPFLSGAISKTINMPEKSSVEEIADAYIFAWEQGLKAVAIYRENSKHSQPLNTKKTEGEVVKKEVELFGKRSKMPQTRRSITHKFDIAGHEGYLTVGLYDDGKPGEIFVTMHKQGSTIRGLIDAWATSVSLNLQYGGSVKELFKKFRYHKFEPAGFVRNVDGGAVDGQIGQIRTASSIVDYVSQFMMNNFGEGARGVRFEVEKPAAENEEQLSLEEFDMEGIACPICGGPAKRIGNCEIMCTSCKQVTRSGCGE
ncbi:MAG: vitamin B12-dependent ribonucleotide reductase [archaeon]